MIIIETLTCNLKKSTGLALFSFKSEVVKVNGEMWKVCLRLASNTCLTIKAGLYLDKIAWDWGLESK